MAERTPAEEIETALGELEALVDAAERRPDKTGAQSAGRPDRYHVRSLFLPLGARLMELGPRSEELAPAIERARNLKERLGKPFALAVLDELSLACAEHVHAVDPRYLSLPNYDFEYTVEARDRLSARLLAAEVLELELPETLLAAVERADATLAPHLERWRETLGSG